MSAGPCTQLISVSRPRDSQAGFGQRCIASPSGFTMSRAAERALLRHLEGPRTAAMLARRADDLRDDVAGALDDHVVALADVLAVDVLLVVQRRARDGDAADLDRLEHGPRVERARAADANLDLVQPRRRRHRRPLECAREARTLVQRAELALLRDRVDLDHDAVDLVVELAAPPLPLGAAPRHLLDRLEPLGEGIRAEAVLAQPLQRVPVRVPSRCPRARRRRRPRSRAASCASSREFFWRTEPAAALRGFGVGFLPSATSRSFSSRKPESGM